MQVHCLSMSNVIILVKIEERSRGREVCKSELHKEILAGACCVPVCLPLLLPGLGVLCRVGKGGQRV